MKTLNHIHRRVGECEELCFNIEARSPLTPDELYKLTNIFRQTFEPELTGEKSFLARDASNSIVLEIGPRLHVETPTSSNIVEICRSIGLEKVERVEISRRHVLSDKEDPQQFIKQHCDPLTQMVYDKPLSTFHSGKVPEPVETLPFLEQGLEAGIAVAKKQLGSSMDSVYLGHHFKVMQEMGRSYTTAEFMGANNQCSEHCEHGFMKSKPTIDGVEMDRTFFQVVKAPLEEMGVTNSLIAFHDNGSCIRGWEHTALVPCNPGQPSSFQECRIVYNIICSAETHNHPSMIEPFQGALTCLGGWLRDIFMVGQGSFVTCACAGYAVGNLLIKGYDIPGEDRTLPYSDAIARPLKILIEASNAMSRYGNEFGVPLTYGFTETFGMVLPDGTRREFLKPIVYGGGRGKIDDRHVHKQKLEPGMLVVRIGGPAYEVGFGGGSASSMLQGENDALLDLKSVQRGNAEAESRPCRVVRVCIDMGGGNIIVSNQDMGAGGLFTAVGECAAPLGCEIDIALVTMGDKSMGALSLSSSEFQESLIIIIQAKDRSLLETICLRERCPCDVLGVIRDDGRFIIRDSRDGTTPVDLPLEKLLHGLPQKTFTSVRLPKHLEPFEIPDEASLPSLIERVFKIPSVGSKGYLVHKADRSVGGLVVRQQCCGPLQLPVADVSVSATGFFGITGDAGSLGVASKATLIDPKAAGRMAAAEALTNLMWVRVTSLRDVKVRLNEMWPAKLPGEGADMYDAVAATSDFLRGVGIDGGKDSLSMAAEVEGELIKSPGTLVVKAYAPVPNIWRVITPDLKKPGESSLGFIDLGLGKDRLGGSAIAQSFGKLGNECPDVDPQMVKNLFKAVQEMIDEKLILAGHDRSDGGLITTLVEMALSGNCGIEVMLPPDNDINRFLFNEEVGAVIEYLPQHAARIISILGKYSIELIPIGLTLQNLHVVVSTDGVNILNLSNLLLRGWWEETSYQLECLQGNPVTAAHESNCRFTQSVPRYFTSFVPEKTDQALVTSLTRPKVAVIRTVGSNSDKEMIASLHLAGFDPLDVAMSDLLDRTISLEGFNGIVFVGGFSHGDVIESAVGWAATIKMTHVWEEILRFRARNDTFILGVCNGAQLVTLLGLVPFEGTPEREQPRLIHNPSRKFESRWSMVHIMGGSVFFKGMEGSRLGIWSSHGEGQFYFPRKDMFERVLEMGLASVLYCNHLGVPTEEYPFCPNGSPFGIAALSSEDGRCLAIMPHPERSAAGLWQWPWYPEGWDSLNASPWLRMFQNARAWCMEAV
ncbi:MAG TPA: phosphoribosylformylglycinamidine synthase [Candidatus Paceibacterota bacterium]